MSTSKPSTTAIVVAGGVALLVAPAVVKGLMKTVTFFRSLGGGAKRQGKIDGYNDQHAADGAEGREKEYAQLVDSYYDLATDFYEWGWGSSFHFADRRSGESFAQSMARHEQYLAGRLGVKRGAKLLDCGCGVGGPARTIAKFANADVTAVTINEFQVMRGNTMAKAEGLQPGGTPGASVELVCGDFMKLPFAAASFDGVYAIESTCHAPDRAGVYGEIFRVLKPGATFACYEWCLTDAYDASNALHRKLKKDIEVGDGLPDIVHTSVCTQALRDAGFEVVEARDCALDGILGKGGEPWYTPLTASWNPLSWPRFQFNPIMFWVMPKLLRFFEIIRLVPVGTKKTQVMLQAGGIGCANGGKTGSFTPMWLMVARKPL
ncbi:S-adenosyl-L-methionine-dependent methyltransferase [Pelagophyceae sp. CCMP2097]|nr:S-adenosyl-L-methionine-dependent methyltransferase [Pelagophyceae sp. CCMP2097]